MLSDGVGCPLGASTQIPGANVPSTQLALAYAACVYFLRDQKRVSLRASLSLPSPPFSLPLPLLTPREGASGYSSGCV